MYVSDKPVNVRVINAVGVQVYGHEQSFSTGRAEVDLQHLAPGIYMLQLSGADGVKQTTRILIAK
jgi:hypothetical protein